jgi:hypothetical protein
MSGDSPGSGSGSSLDLLSGFDFEASRSKKSHRSKSSMSSMSSDDSQVEPAAPSLLSRLVTKKKKRQSTSNSLDGPSQHAATMKHVGKRQSYKTDAGGVASAFLSDGGGSGGGGGGGGGGADDWAASRHRTVSIERAQIRRPSTMQSLLIGQRRGTSVLSIDELGASQATFAGDDDDSDDDSDDSDDDSDSDESDSDDEERQSITEKLADASAAAVDAADSVAASSNLEDLPNRLVDYFARFGVDSTKLQTVVDALQATEKTPTLAATGRVLKDMFGSASAASGGSGGDVGGKTPLTFNDIVLLDRYVSTVSFLFMLRCYDVCIGMMRFFSWSFPLNTAYFQ